MHRRCQHCNKEYTPIQKTQKFCGAECRSAGYVYSGPRIENCLTCGEPFQKVNDNHKYCTPSCNSNIFGSVSRKDLNLNTNKEIDENWQKDFYEKAERMQKIKRLDEKRKRKRIEIKKQEQFKIPSRRVGDIEELFVTQHLLREGWEVFKNSSACGPADIILWNKENGETHLVDVKSSEESASSRTVLQKAEKYNVKTGWFNGYKNKFVIINNHNKGDLKCIEI